MHLRRITAFLLVCAALGGVTLADTTDYGGNEPPVKFTFDLPKDIALTDFSGSSVFTGQINGLEYSFTGRPFLLYSVTYVPLRDLANAFGMSVEWVNADRQAILISGSKMLVVSADTNLKPAGSVLWSGNSTQFFDQTAVIVNGRTYLPLRFVLETFGFTVEYDNTERSISLSGEVQAPITYSAVIDGVHSMIVESVRSFDSASKVSLTGVGDIAFTAGVERVTDIEGRRYEIYRINDTEGECVLTNSINGAGFYFDGDLAEPSNIDIYMQLSDLALSGIHAYESLGISGYEVTGNVAVCRINTIGGKSIDMTIWVDTEAKKLMYYSVRNKGAFSCPEITMEISY